MSFSDSNKAFNVIAVATITTFVTLVYLWGNYQQSLSNHDVISNHETLPNSNTEMSRPKIPLPDQEAISKRIDTSSSATTPKTRINNALPGLSTFTQELIKKLRTEYLDQIANIAFQVSLKEIKEDMIRTYPARGAESFADVVKSAFPDYANSIFSAIEKMAIYDEWLLNNLLVLNEISLLDQQNTLWQKRYELFGDAAKEIWQEEISAEQERQASVKKSVTLLDTAYDTPMDDRLSLFTTSFNESFSGSMQDSVLDSKGLLSQVFFGFDAVQRDLQAMTPEDRQQQINDIRRSIGYEENLVIFLADQDQQKERRWQNGYDYMAARQQAIDSGVDNEERLAQIRNAHFGKEASTIAKEEEIGFYRYQRPRIYGRN